MWWNMGRPSSTIFISFHKVVFCHVKDAILQHDMWHITSQ